MSGLADFIVKCHKDPLYRINTCYQIINKQSEQVPFNLNAQQQHLFETKHNRNLILKARQIGSTTFWCMYFLDKAIWNDNQFIGIISHSIESAQSIFRRIRFALDSMHPELRDAIGVKQDSTRQLVFRNNSMIRVDTTMRGETLSGLLVSEYGRIAAHWPAKAEEVLTGALNTLSANAECCIESTAEGVDGYYHEMVQSAMARGNENLSPLEFKFFFFPWFEYYFGYENDG
jgi:hypothetical protein